MGDGEVGKWIEAIHEKTVESDDKVIAYTQRRPLPKRYVAARKLAQALLDGKPSRIEEGDWQYAPDANWGSWIEGVPLLHAAMLNRDVIVDLLPTPTEDDFIRSYKCRPAQFLTVVRRLRNDGRRVYINIRDYDPARRVNGHDGGLNAYEASGSVLGPVFQALSEDGFTDVYLNAVRRNRLVEGLGGGELMKEAADRVGHALGERLHVFLSDHGRVKRDYAQCLVRGEAVPAPAQALYRIAYNLAFRELLPDVMSDNTALPELVAKAERKEDISDLELADAIFAATMLHHKFTAPLTGAYGGIYNLDEREMSQSELVAQKGDVLGEARQAHSKGFLTVLYGVLNGHIGVERRWFRRLLVDKRRRVLSELLEQNQPIGVAQEEHVPSPVEVDAFFDNMEPVQQWLQRKSAMRKRFQQALVSSKAEGKELDAEAVLNLLNNDLEACRDKRKQFAKAGAAALFGIAAAGAAPAAAGTGMLASVAFPVGGVLLGVMALAAHIGAELGKDSVCGALCTQDDEKQVWSLFTRR